LTLIKVTFVWAKLTYGTFNLTSEGVEVRLTPSEITIVGVEVSSALVKVTIVGVEVTLILIEVTIVRAKVTMAPILFKLTPRIL
jgi:hypothetical protein